MKKVISIIVLLSLIFTAILPIMVFAAEEAVTVTADEGWATATYDPSSAVLTNVSEGYSFKITRNDSALTAILNPNVSITAQKVVIPSAFVYDSKTYKITGIKEYILGKDNTSVEEVIVSEGITALGAPSESKGTGQTFRSATGLKSVRLPATLTALSGNCFMGCTNLLSINIPEEVTTIPGQAFSGCSSLTEVTFNGNNLTTFLESAFAKCTALTSMELPSSVTSIGKSAFSESGILELTVPAGVTRLEDSTFYKTKALKITFKGNITDIGTNVFQYSSVTEMRFEGDIAPTTFVSFGQYSGSGVTVYYPAVSTGYDSLDFRALFTKATFIQLGKYNTVHINISPGRDDSELNVSWYGVHNAPNTYLQIAPKGDDDSFPVENAETIVAVQAETKSSFKSNKATATGLVPNTEYVYRVGDGSNWGNVYTYHTRGLTSFDFLFTTDAHIGVTTPEKDAALWADTLSKAQEKYPNASLMLSGGDQADKGTDYQFSNFFEPSALRNLLIAAVSGSNHDNVVNYKYYFNLPNLSETYGITNDNGETITSNYYFTYGDALFMMLNTCNNSNLDTHKNFMNETITANPDYKWKFVVFHHSIFSAGDRYPLDDGSYVDRLRKGLSPTFSSLGIDAIFMGHDHGYTRTYIMNGMTPQTEQTIDEDGRIVNATGVQYITGNSSTGNKFYDLIAPLPNWVKVADEDHTVFSGVSVRGNTIIITTYRTDTMEVIDTVTICKEDALTLENANVLLSADKDILSMVDSEAQLTLTVKQGEDIDLQNAIVTYETTEDGTLTIDENGKVTIENMPEQDKTFRIWAKVTVGDQTFISNAVNMRVKSNQLDFSVLEDKISYVGRKDDTDIPIPADTQVLPTDIDSLIVNVSVVKNRPTDKNLVVIAGLYDREGELISVKIHLMNNEDYLMDVGMEYAIPIELNIPNEISSEDLYAKVFFWSDITSLMPMSGHAEIAK